MVTPGRRGFPHANHPWGWFQVAWSHELPAGTVHPLKYFDRDLVAYRDDLGTVHVLDAHCMHMGAHLGYGGRVEGDCIVCPFHGWVWAPDGTNVRIPHSKLGSNRGRKIRTWQVREQNHVVYLWHGRGDPEWEPPVIAEFEDADGYSALDVGRAEGVLRLYPQMLVENIVDSEHLWHVHAFDGAPPQLLWHEPDGHRFAVRTSAELPTARETAAITIESTAYGVGLVAARLSGLAELVHLTAATPVSTDLTHVRLTTVIATTRTNGQPTEPALRDAMIAAQNRAILSNDRGDRDIWENQQYLTNPAFTPEEAQPFRSLREWSSRFYQEPDER